jgi:hypothetical protein
LRTINGCASSRAPIRGSGMRLKSRRGKRPPPRHRS